MKGPYERLKYDLRRLWECPQCHRRDRTDGSVTYCFCSCQVKGGGQPIPMKLLEEAGHRTVSPIVPKISEDVPTLEAAASSALETPLDQAPLDSSAEPAAKSGDLPLQGE